MQRFRVEAAQRSEAPGRCFDRKCSSRRSCSRRGGSDDPAATCQCAVIGQRNARRHRMCLIGHAVAARGVVQVCDEIAALSGRWRAAPDLFVERIESGFASCVIDRRFVRRGEARLTGLVQLETPRRLVAEADHRLRRRGRVSRPNHQQRRKNQHRRDAHTAAADSSQLELHVRSPPGRKSRERNRPVRNCANCNGARVASL